jgi:hypothetical protein
LSKPFVVGDAGALFLPRGADLIAALVPFDRGSLERAIDRFVEQLDDVGAPHFGRRSPARMLLLTMAIAGSALALEVVLRRLQNRCPAVKLQSHGPGARKGLPGFPELPGNWHSRPT